MMKKLMALGAFAAIMAVPAVQAQTEDNGGYPVVTDVQDYESEQKLAVGVTLGANTFYTGLYDAGSIFDSFTKASVVLNYKISETLRLAPEVGTLLSGKVNCYSANLNLQEVWNLNRTFKFDAPQVNLYGITGGAYNYWKIKGNNTGLNSFGVTLGGGADITILRHLRFSIEERFTLMNHARSNYETVVGVHYVF